MGGLQQVVATIGLAIHLFLLLIGLRQQRFRKCLTFYVYLLATFSSTVVITYVVNEKDLRRQIYYLKEFLLDIIKLAMLLELNHKIFRFFPRVQRSNRALFGITGILFIVYALAFPAESKSWWGSVPFDLHSKVLQTTCLAYLVMVFSALYYRIEVLAEFKYLLMGYLFSQLPVALGFAYVAIVGEAARKTVSLLNSLFFVVAMLVWTRVYWVYDKDSNSPSTLGSRVDDTISTGAA